MSDPTLKEGHLFLSDALQSRKKDYGTVIRPIAPTPNKVIGCLILMIAFFLMFASLFEVEQRVQFTGVAMLVDKPVSVFADVVGYIEHIEHSNGDYITKDQPVVVLKTNTVCGKDEPECNLITMKAPITGYIERLDRTPGDRIMKNDLIGLVIPKSLVVKFNFQVPVNEINEFSEGDQIKVEWPDDSGTSQSVTATVKYVSKIPVQRGMMSDGAERYLVELIPNQSTELATGTVVTMNRVIGKATVMSMLNKK